MLSTFADIMHYEYLKNKAEVEAYASQHKIPIWLQFPDGTIMAIDRLVNGKPIYNITANLEAAQTVHVDELWPGGNLNLNLTGNGYSKISMWDGGKVLITHQEFDGRVSQVDTMTIIIDHSTHVAGTLVAEGQVASAKGMAYQAVLDAYYWDDAEAEMALAAAAGMEESNHSYVHGTGWIPSQWTVYWLGDMSISSTEDYKFGFYSSDAYSWDEIAYNAPYYLIVKAGGNDRNHDYSGEHKHADGTIHNDYHEPDGGTDHYDCIPDRGVAKNILTVGAVEKVLNYISPSDVVMSNFSSWGPADDGRIKPDLVAKGVNTYSAYSAHDSEYGYISGTSMAAPSITGSMVLLRQHFQNLNPGNKMRASTLKALVIHTADETGDNIGPDYQFGWGLFNAERATRFISINSKGKYVIDEQVLLNGNTFKSTVYSHGTKPLKVTICWTDLPGTPLIPSLNPRTPMLVNDLDLRIIKDATSYFPWQLDYAHPSNAATNSSKNNVDNVEQVYIATPTAGTYTIEVSHDGTLTGSGGSQAFSIIVSGNSECIDGSIIYNTETGKFNFCEDGVWVEK